ncbi:DNA recombination protein RmuC [Gottfriedia sp. NPDC056225]|uniref:DNA recombination protein RmuC n=1 Tax=Gottfriedia sp. NPDC056225 TaxID=3345751 RepID=UPI0035D89D6E
MLAGSVLVNLILTIIILFVSLKLKQGSMNQDTSVLKEIVFKQIAEANEKTEKKINEELKESRKENYEISSKNREELSKSLLSFSENIQSQITQSIQLQQTFNKDTNDNIKQMINKNEKQMDNIRNTLESSITKLQENNIRKLDENKEKTSKTISEGLNEVRNILELNISKLQEDNSKKLEEMRMTVDEKLNNTLEQRLGEKFKLVSERLEQVHTGLGEMKTLATGVGDLKKVLSNVKTRGIWGEIQLGNILEQTMTPDQYVENFATKKNSAERVEFAIKFPSKQDSKKYVYLPIDSKFPNDIYERLVDAQESGNVELVREAVKQLESRIKAEAKTINEKYISPPVTTDFGVLFLPTESLYAEVLKINGLLEFLQNTYRITVAGPTTMAALLNSFQMGFRTLAIEKRSSEVWDTLGKVKTEFGKFGDILEKTKKKLQAATNEIEVATRKTRTIERSLRDVQELPTNENEFIALAD